MPSVSRPITVTRLLKQAFSSWLVLCGLAMPWGMPIAMAGELLVMPFQCRLTDGRVVLIPSEQIGHRIVSHHEQRDLTVCSPVDSQRCRHINVHNFKVDCSGTEVTWAAVVAASSSARSGQAYLEAGRLHLRMPTDWNRSPNDPCLGTPQDNAFWRDGRRNCYDREAPPRPTYVELPAGFAPTLGLDAIFVPEGPPATNGEIQAMATQPTPAPAPASSTQGASAPAKKKVSTSQFPTSTPSQPVTAPPQLPQAAISSAPTAPNSPPAQQATSSPIVSLPVTIPAPTPPTAMPETKPVELSAAPTTTAQPTVKPVTTEATAITSVDANSQLAPTMHPEPDHNRGTGNSGGLAGILLAGDGVGLMMAGPGLLVLGALAWMFVRSATADDDRPPQHDIATVSFTQTTSTGPAAGFDDENSLPFQGWAADGMPRDPSTLSLAMGGTALQTVARDRTLLTFSPGREPSVPAALDWPTEIPKSKDEALRILGMGLTADTSASALKKLVDGLRMSWHPDLARDEADRLLREQRIRQINAAWDIVSRPRAELEAS